jgi:DNA-binding MarR family transcriptional regulator
MTLLAECSPLEARTRLARVLLDNAAQLHQITQSDMAELGKMDWETVKASLRSLQANGAIRLERNRLIIHKKLLQTAAGLTKT